MMTASSIVIEMHLHYLWVSMGPSGQSWFRQHLTTLQLFQCFFNFARLVVVMFRAPSCDFPWQISVISFCYQALVLAFYIKSYMQLYVPLDSMD